MVQTRVRNSTQKDRRRLKQEIRSIHTRVSHSFDRVICYRLDAIQRNTEWHETYEKFSVGKKNKINEKEIALELQQANVELKMLRNRRLKDLYTAEWE